MIKTLQVREGGKEAFNGSEDKSLYPESNASVGNELILSFRSTSNTDKEFAKGTAELWKSFAVNWTGTFLSVDKEGVLKGRQRKEELSPGQCQRGRVHRTPRESQGSAAAEECAQAKHLCLGVSR